jgi:hypothetical protein
VLRRLLESFERAEAQAFEARKTAAIEESNRLKQQELDEIHAEYLRRREVGDSPIMKELHRKVERLQKENAELKTPDVIAQMNEHCRLLTKVAELEAKLAATPPSPPPQTDVVQPEPEPDPQVAEWKKGHETLKRLQAEAASKTSAVLAEWESALNAEWKELNDTPPRLITSEIHERMKAIALDLAIIAGVKTNQKAG